MALSNRDRVGKMFEVMAPALDDFISTVIGGAAGPATNWVDLVKARDEAKDVTGRTYDPLDPQVQLRMLTESSITKAAKPGWFPFDGGLGRTGESFASELREARNKWAHNGSFSDDDAYRILDTGERLLRLINFLETADEVKAIRLNLRRITADRDDKRALKQAAADNPASEGLRLWRDVLPPHDDVATGRFQASEFAADLYKVATRAEDQGKDYSDPVEFFSRTYLTEGLRDLIGRAVRRISGDDNASPVINLQTNFGGGKTHSMLSLWHIAGDTPLTAYPQEVQELLHANGFKASAPINRVAIVGNHFSPSGEDKSDGARVNTIWGELAWQLGGAEAYELVAEADRTSSPPGGALHTLLQRYAPAVILVDEWVAYARGLVGRDDRAGGSFDDQFTFAQALTEAVKGTSGVLLAVSIPASETGDDEQPAGNAEEVGGTNGLEALKRLQNVVRRVADQWRPASSDEAYHIVRRRLFVTPDSAALASIGATAREFGELYRKHSADFPRESRDHGYEERIKRTYPIHPELFDRLYEDWSSLERFQRTRGVLRLMNTVIHALWVGEDGSPLIMPGSIPLSVSDVNSELTQYLPDSWKAIIDADVDGTNSEPHKIDKNKPLFGQRSLTKRLARAVFFGAAPTIGSAHKGIETQRVFLGTAMPGDTPGNFHSALTQLGDRATYFYSGQGKYWYDLQANISRRAKDQAERMYKEDVWAEIIKRLSGQSRTHGDFAAVHVCPEDSADIPDVDEARLVILHPRFGFKRNSKDTEALDFAQKATENKGTGHRTHRNMVVYLAPDADRLAELDTAIRDYLGWDLVLLSHDLDLTDNQRNQAQEKRTTADNTVNSRLLQTYHWMLAPEALNPAAPFKITTNKVDGQSPALSERVSKRLRNGGNLNVVQAANLVRMQLNLFPNLWQAGHVRIGELWKVYSSYAYMPRLRDQDVLNRGVLEHPLHWAQESFALATYYDDQDQRYIGLTLPTEMLDGFAVNDATLLVQPARAIAQREAEEAQAAETRTNHAEGSTGTTASTGTSGGATGVRGGGSLTRGGRSQEPPIPVAKTRFFGAKALDSAHYQLDFKKIADEVLAHLSATAGTDLVVRVEIEAVNPAGFDDSKIRTISENSQTLKFEQSGFEEE